MKEYDLIDELGPQNWLDVLAGEAVLFGYTSNEPEMVVRGTKLAHLIRTWRYDHDRFALVQAYADGLEKELARNKEKIKMTVFIDELFCGERRNKSLNDWEYNLILMDGRYSIVMSLPVYRGTDKLFDAVKIKAERSVISLFPDPSFKSGRVETTETIYDCGQVFVHTRYLDEKGILIKRTIDFNHEGVTDRGWIEYFYFDDFAQAFMAWRGVREAIISSQKK